MKLKQIQLDLSKRSQCPTGIKHTTSSDLVRFFLTPADQCCDSHTRMDASCDRTNTEIINHLLILYEWIPMPSDKSFHGEYRPACFYHFMHSCWEKLQTQMIIVCFPWTWTFNPLLIWICSWSKASPLNPPWGHCCSSIVTSVYLPSDLCSIGAVWSLLIQSWHQELVKHGWDICSSTAGAVRCLTDCLMVTTIMSSGLSFPDQMGSMDIVDSRRTAAVCGLFLLIVLRHNVAVCCVVYRCILQLQALQCCRTRWWLLLYLHLAGGEIPFCFQRWEMCSVYCRADTRNRQRVCLSAGRPFDKQAAPRKKTNKLIMMTFLFGKR